MDESLEALEARLEQLVPKGLSDLGRERMEEQIDELAAALPASSGGTWGRWSAGLAAAVAGLAAVAWWPEPAAEVVAAVPATPARALPVPRKAVSPSPSEQQMRLLTLMMARHVQTRTDEGWAMAEGAETPHRYWSYEVTDEEELIDPESGYAVRVVSQQEEWVPVAMSSL